MRPPPPVGAALPRLLRGLFGTPLNAALTLLLGWALLAILPGLWRWAVTDSLGAPATLEQCVRAGGACWSFIEDRWRLILFGTFPYAEQWRAGLALALFAALVVLTALRPRPWVLACWALILPAIGALMWGGVAGLAEVPSRLWGGLPLTVMLASVGMAAGFVVAVLLALARTGDLPAFRWAAVIFIEFLRGVPLVALLFLAHLLFPLVLPPGIEIDKLLRAQIAFALFFAVYMAEAIRGGIQAIPAGQKDAARALGLGWWHTQALVVLPQALRLVIPSLVNIFIAAFKDTSLVVVIAMIDLLGAANAATAEARWWGLFLEAYVFVAAIYLVVCAAMSAYARRLERNP